MNNIVIAAVVIVLAAGGYLIFTSNVTNIEEEVMHVQEQLAVETPPVREEPSSTEDGPSVQPISHASMVWTWEGTTFYIDPVGGPSLYEDMMAPDVVLLTDIHGDHLNIDTVAGIISPETQIVVPQAVFDQLPAELAGQSVVMNNGETIELRNFLIEAMPMYNLPESDDARHVKGRGNGYLVSRDDHRVYVAGDTAGIPEMRALTDIDMAFVPMNLPYTMSVAEAAEAVLAFAPRTVIPYHYRTPEGFSDVAEFKRLVNAGNARINVLMLNWYPEQEGDDEE